MQSLGELLAAEVNETILDQFICEGCGRETKFIRAIIPRGPDKGKSIERKRGCVCFENEQAREAKKEQVELKIRKIADKYSTITPNLEKSTLLNYKPNNESQADAWIASTNYTELFNPNESKNLLFQGSYGIGKSHLAYSICKELRSKGYTAIFISVPKLLTSIRSTYNKKDGVTEGELVEALSQVDLLALDDIGAERSKKDDDGESWATEKLFEIIDGRSGRNTVYTTNLGSEELSYKVGGRNFSRMMMNTTVYKLVGKDHRIKEINF